MIYLNNIEIISPIIEFFIDKASIMCIMNIYIIDGGKDEYNN